MNPIDWTSPGTYVGLVFATILFGVIVWVIINDWYDDDPD